MESVTYCIQSGQGERCFKHCPMYQKCWSKSKGDKKNARNKSSN